MEFKFKGGRDGTPAELALYNPVPTAQKRLLQFARTPKRKGAVTIPALDLDEVRRKYGPRTDTPPAPLTATFRVPLNTDQAHYESIRNAAVARFLKAMEGDGWEFYSPNRIQVAPGVYPAYDIQDGCALLDQREFLVRAWFRRKKPETIEVEIPANLLRDTVIRA